MRLFHERMTAIPIGAVMLALLAMLSPLRATAADHGDCGDPFTPIYEIQGSGQDSLLDGEIVITEGIVTVDLQRSSELSGFFIQDRFGDGDPATSESATARWTASASRIAERVMP